MSINTNPLKLFYCYAKEDEKLRDQLTVHITPLRRVRKLTIWLDVLIQAGADWKLEVEKQLKEADIILLLISPDFMASDYCYNLQLTAAFNYYEAGKLEIIPILLRPVLWEETPIKRLPIILPTSKIAVTLWPNYDEALRNIAAGIRDVIQAKLSSSRSLPSKEIDILNQLGKSVLSTQCPRCGTHNRIGARFCKNDGTDLVSSKMVVIPKPVPPIRTKESWIEQGNVLYKRRQYIDALAAYEQALRLNPNDAIVHCNKGNILLLLQRYHEALAAFEQALQLDPGYARAYKGKGTVFYDLKQYHEALAAFEQVLQLNPKDADAYCNKGTVFYDLKQYHEALAAYEQALQLDPKDAAIHRNKGHALRHLQRYHEALAAYEQALRLNPNDAAIHCNEGNILLLLQRYHEALAAFEQALRLNPKDAAIHCNEGNILLLLQRYHEALAAFEQALQLDPGFAGAYKGKGRVYEILGLVDAAKEAFRKAASLNSTSS